MRAFIILSFVAFAWADKLGYNYQPVAHSNSGLSFTPGSPSFGSGLSSVGGGLGNAGGGLGNVGGGLGNIGGGLGNVGGGLGNLGGGLGNIGGGLGNIVGGLGNAGSGQRNVGNGFGNVGDGLGNVGSSYLAPAASSLTPSLGSAVLSEPIQPAASSYSSPVSEFNKEFYTFSAPEQDFVDGDVDRKISNSLKQGLRVIFIKGPENKALENAALNLAKQASEQKTAIYVLNKQTDIGDLANKLNVIRNNNNAKPEVHFVKYRTPEDAANAQRQIQSQYDSLGGTSQSHNGGLAPVINFASQGPAHHVPEPNAPDNSYLPASIFKRI